MKLTKIALGVALATGTVAAQAATTLFFPHVVVSGTVTTIATVVNRGASATPPGQHWIYVGKNLLAGETVADFNAKTCNEVDVMLPSSDNNIQTVDLGAVISKAGDYGVIFNDPSINNQWRQKLGGGSINYSLAHAYMTPVGALGTRGYLVVDETGNGTLEGSALVFDYKTGSAWGYKAEVLDTAVTAHGHAPFSAHLMPKAEAISRLMITPLADAKADMLPGGTDFGAWGVTVAPQLVGTGHVVDRDENPISGAASDSVVCVGTVDLWNILAPGAAQFAPDGGWVSVATAAGTPGAAARAVVYQLDFGGQGATAGTLNGVAYPGTWNNVYGVQ